MELVIVEDSDEDTLDAASSENLVRGPSVHVLPASSSSDDVSQHSNESQNQGKQKLLSSLCQSSLLQVTKFKLNVNHCVCSQLELVSPSLRYCFFG